MCEGSELEIAEVIMDFGDKEGIDGIDGPQ